MSFSSDIKSEILEKFDKYSKNNNYKRAERFGELLTIKSTKQELAKDYLELFEIENLNEELIKAIIKGAFLSSGCITDPNTSYHFEIALKNKACSEFLINLLSFLEFTPKLIKREKHSQYVIYVKEAEQISTLLNLMDASKSLLDFENIRVEKDVKNNINRTVNCETANLTKTINASLKQIDAIDKIKKNNKFNTLDERLKAVANMRLKYKDESIEFLSNELSKTEKISKSGVKHRLDKIIKIADEI